MGVKMNQQVFDNRNDYEGLDKWIAENKIIKLFVVCDDSFKLLRGIGEKIKRLELNGTMAVLFNDFSPNPVYESVVKGVGLFKNSGANAIIAIGGGSAIDVAKCIKLYSTLEVPGDNGRWLTEPVLENNIPLLAIPTTAGTGSEATRYAVIYYNGAKQSITSDNCIPGSVLFDSTVLESLPTYQRKSTMCDALCHAIESFWSVNSNEESKEYSALAIKEIIKHMDGYLNNTVEGNEGMLRAANIAGKAINIAQTTAGHAMCYKLTSIFGISHGHAAMLCDRVLFPWMTSNTEKCIDERGSDYLKKVFEEITNALDEKNIDDALCRFERIFEKLNLDIPVASDEQIIELVSSVNTDRLKNHPIKINENDLSELYKQILKKER